ncbi:MAG TPA: hypothetical protein VK175_04955 [Leadbetterella sp.]|nr:hypothetical protein [Leadbetterella sp.]
MKTKLFLFGVLLLSSCDLIESIKPNGDLGGTQSAMGEVGNTFSLGSVAGISGAAAEVKSLTSGVSEISATATISDATLLTIAKNIPELVISGNKVSITKKYRITDEGIQNVYEDGNFTLVKYSDKVGQKYTHKVDGKTITREITYISTNDEYAYGFLAIKVIRVEEAGRAIPGVSKIEYITNHKFGLVGFKTYFEDGSSKEVRFFSYN